MINSFRLQACRAWLEWHTDFFGPQYQVFSHCVDSEYNDKGNRAIYSVQFSAVITRTNLSWYYIRHCDENRKKSWWQWQKANQILESQQTTHCSAVTIMRIWERRDRVITAPHYIYSTEKSIALRRVWQRAGVLWTNKNVLLWCRYLTLSVECFR